MADRGSGLGTTARVASAYAEGHRNMMSWKRYLWVNSIVTGGLLLSAGLALWLYSSGSPSENGWIVLVQVVTAVANAALFAVTYSGTRRRMEQARADATLPAWRPPTTKLDW